MLEHRAAMQQQLLDQESDLSRRALEKQRRQELRREQVLDRLWEIAKMAPEMTRNSITGQVKALQMIVAMESLIPDRHAGSSENKSAPPFPHPEKHPAACPPCPAAGLCRHEGHNLDHQPDPALAQEEDPGLNDPEPTPGSAGDAPQPLSPTPNPFFDSIESFFANPLSSLEATRAASHTSAFFPALDPRAAFSKSGNPFAGGR
jgi:hypothetical protein